MMSISKANIFTLSHSSGDWTPNDRADLQAVSPGTNKTKGSPYQCDCVQMRDHIDHTEIASPVTNKFYLEQPHGEIYGLDHSRERLVVVTIVQPLYLYASLAADSTH